MNSTSTEQTTDQYNVTSGFTETHLLSSEFVSHNGSTTYSYYNETSVVVLLSTTSSNFVGRSNGDPGNGSNSSDLITGITVSCVTCAVILLIVVPLVIWRCRAFSQHATSSAVDRVEARKYGPVSVCFVA